MDGALQSERSAIPFLKLGLLELITCQVTPNDGKVDGDYDEVSVTVSISPPVVDSVTLSPSTVYTNDTITGTWF